MIALRRPSDYSPEQGARFEVHFEKLRNRVEPSASVPFEARLETVIVDRKEALRWSCCDLAPPVLKQAAELYEVGMTVREVATELGISKSEAGRLRQKAVEGGVVTLAASSR